jgi:hypothetical protein
VADVRTNDADLEALLL